MKSKLFIVLLIVLASVAVFWKLSPFFLTWKPSKKAKEIGAAVVIKYEDIKVGEPLTVTWRGKPLVVMRFSEEIKNDLKSLENHVCRSGVVDEKNSIVVLEKISTHLGCIVEHIPKDSASSSFDKWFGGYRDPCHGYLYDYAGRVIDNSPHVKDFLSHAERGPRSCSLEDLPSPKFKLTDDSIIIDR